MIQDFKPDHLLSLVLNGARRKAMARLFQDRGGSSTATVVVAGVARSGTTWLGEVLASRGPTRMMFEPFHAYRVSGYRRFEYLQYVRPESDEPELFAFADDVFRGRIRDPGWVDKNVKHLLPQMRVVKDVRICMFLRWLNDRFPDLPAVFILRHPCAVVASHLHLGWSMDDDLRSVLSQPELIDDHLGTHVEWLRGLSDPLDQVAAIWCVQNLVALRQLGGTDVPILYYENMVRNADRVVPAVFDAMKLEFDPAILDGIKRHSSTVAKDSPLKSGEDPTTAWSRRLTDEQIRRVLEIVERFELDSLYDGTDPASEPAVLSTAKFY